MSKKIITLILAAAFTVSVAGVSVAAKAVRCKVTAVDGNTVTLDCKKADQLKAGMKVKVKEAKKKAVEGC
jgi:outer membrane protein assembly factor BamE (lipoprotein component of BamABCDE complex)